MYLKERRATGSAAAFDQRESSGCDGKEDSPLDDLLVDVDLDLDLLDERLLVGVGSKAEALHLLDAADDGERAPEGLLLLVDV